MEEASRADKAHRKTKRLLYLSGKGCWGEAQASRAYLKDRLEGLTKHAQGHLQFHNQQLADCLLLNNLPYQRMHLPALAQSRKRNCHREKYECSQTKGTGGRFSIESSQRKDSKTSPLPAFKFTPKANLTNSPKADLSWLKIIFKALAHYKHSTSTYLDFAISPTPPRITSKGKEWLELNLNKEQAWKLLGEDSFIPKRYYKIQVAPLWDVQISISH